jgi:NitT/TauT family transport system substrate-binding protein
MKKRSFWAAAVGVGGMLSLLSSGSASSAKDVTVALADQMRVGYYWLYLPEVLGYWKNDGLTVDVVSVGGSVEALQQIIAGHAQFGQMGADNVVEANAKENIPAQIALLNGVFQWRLATPAEKRVEKVEDLKGKSIGVYSLTTNGNLFLKAYLAEHGLVVDKDVQLVPVGYGGPALHALDSGEVAALYFWPSAFTAYEDQGYKFRFFGDDRWSHYPDYSLATLKTVADSDPKMVTDLVRGMVKALVFARTNPECAVKMFWKAHPDSKPADVSDDVALTRNTNVLKAQLAEYEPAPALFGENRLGAVDAAAVGLLQEFLQKNGQISAAKNPADMIVSIPGYFEAVNDFDKQAIEKTAKICTP